MVKGTPLDLDSDFKVDFFHLLHDYYIGNPNFYRDFNILNDLSNEVSNSISLKVKKIKREISREEKAVAFELLQRYEPVLSDYHDLIFKSIYLMLYSSFKNCLLNAQKIIQKYATCSIEVSSSSLCFFKENNLIKTQSVSWENAIKLKEIRNVITHNNSHIPEKVEYKDLKSKIKRFPGISVFKPLFGIVIEDISFLHFSIETFQSFLDEIEKNVKAKMF